MKIFSFILIIPLVFITFISNSQQKIIIKNSNVIDIKSGKVLKNQNLLIENGFIKEITSKSISKSSETKTIDATGKYIIPGLWDMHVHLYFDDKDFLRLYMANGVIGIREMAGAHIEWKKEIYTNSNMPHIIFGSPIFDGEKPWFPDIKPIKYENIESAIKNYKDKGYDFIKILSLVNQKHYDKIVKICKRYKIPFAGHIPYSIKSLLAAKRGQLSNEHLNGVLLSCSDKEDELRAKLNKAALKGKKGLIKVMKSIKIELLKSYNEQKAIKFIKKLKNYSIYQCPTLTVSKNFAYDECDFLKTDGRINYFPAWVANSKPVYDTLPERIILKRKELKLKQHILGLMNKNGIKIIAGTDNGFSGFNLHDELKYLTQSGFSNLDALKTATINAVEFLQLENLYGTIEKGKKADLVILNSNPLLNIDNTRDIQYVIFKNKLIKPKDYLKVIYDKINKPKTDKELIKTLFSIGYTNGLKSMMQKINRLKLKKEFKNRDWEKIFLSVAVSLGYHEKNKSAIAILKYVIKNYPKKSSAYFYLGEINERLNNRTEAIKNYKNALKLDSTNLDARSRLRVLEK